MQGAHAVAPLGVVDRNILPRLVSGGGRAPGLWNRIANGECRV